MVNINEYVIEPGEMVIKWCDIGALPKGGEESDEG